MTANEIAARRLYRAVKRQHGEYYSLERSLHEARARLERESGGRVHLAEHAARCGPDAYGAEHWAAAVLAFAEYRRIEDAMERVKARILRAVRRADWIWSADTAAA